MKSSRRSQQRGLQAGPAHDPGRSFDLPAAVLQDMALMHHLRAEAAQLRKDARARNRDAHQVRLAIEKHLRRHGVSFAAVEEAMRREAAVLADDSALERGSA